MVLPIATDGQQVLRQLIKDVSLLKRGVGNLQASATASEFTAETVLTSDVDNTNGMTLYQDVVMNPDVVAEGQVDDDGESILTDKQLWVVVPSAPQCTTDAQTVSVTWDGRGAGDERIPDNFGLVEIHRSLDEFFEVEGPETLVGVLALPGSIVFTGQAYGLPHYFRFVLVTSDGRRSQASDTGMGMSVAVGIGDLDPSTIDEIQQGAVDEAKEYTDSVIIGASGNAIHYSVLPPAGEANNVGDIWFQRNAITGAIMGQWFGAGGTTWDETSLSHEVISSVDLGTATVGLLSADYIDTGNLSADVTVTGTLMAGNPHGGRIVFDAEGLKQFVDETRTVIFFPNDPNSPAQFEGTIQAQSITVQDNLTIQGTKNFVAQAAVLSVGAGVQTAQSPVSLQVGYSTYDPGRWTSGSLFIPIGVHGNVDNTGDIYTALTFYGYGKMLSTANRYYTWPERTDSAGTKRGIWGAFTSSVMIHTAAGAERLVAVGLKTLNNGDVAAPRIGVFDMSTMNSSGTLPPTEKVNMTVKGDDYTYETRLGRVFSPVGSTTFKERFAVGALRYLTNDVELKQWTTTDSGFTLAGTTIIVGNPLVTDEKFIGVTHGSSDKLGFPGTAQYVWLIHGSVNTYAYTSAGVRLPDFDFPSPAGQVRMTAWGDVATNTFLGFRTTAWADTTPVTQLTNNHWVSPTSDKWWVSSTWYDSDATGGTHETTQGPRASITMKKRAGLTFTIPTYPDRPFPTTTDDVIAARVFLNRGASDPTRPNMERVATLTAPNRSGYVGTFTFPSGAAGSPPPVTNDFPQTSPGKISSADGARWVLQGDGSAIIGPINITASPSSVSTIVGNWNAYLGDTASTVQNLTEYRIKGVSNALKFRNRNYLANEGGISVAKVSLFYEDDVEMTRLHYYIDGRGLGIRDTRTTTKWSYYRADGVLSTYMRTQEFVSNLASTSTTSTTGATMGAAGAQGTFIAPPSGIVEIEPFCTLRVSAEGQAAVLSYEVRTGATIGSGSIVPGYGADIDRGPQNSNPANIRTSWPTLVSGLVAGDTYNVRTIMMSGVSTNTATFAHTRLMVRPVM